MTFISEIVFCNFPLFSWPLLAQVATFPVFLTYLPWVFLSLHRAFVLYKQLHDLGFSLFAFELICGCIFREGNGNPLQYFCLENPMDKYSCLENPMDGGAWKASVHGAARSRTRLSDFTFTFHFSLSCIGEGNGNPLQCSCLENPRGGGAWWAAVYGVAQSWTRLKRLSSSSSGCIFIHAFSSACDIVFYSKCLLCSFLLLLYSESHSVWLFATPWTIQSMEFSRPGYWSR